MASYLAVTTSHEVIEVRVLNFKMAASGFVNVTEGVLNVIKKNALNWRAQNMLLCLAKRKRWDINLSRASVIGEFAIWVISEKAQRIFAKESKYLNFLMEVSLLLFIGANSFDKITMCKTPVSATSKEWAFPTRSKYHSNIFNKSCQLVIYLVFDYCCAVSVGDATR